MLLHTLRGQYEAIHGEPNVVFRKQQHFQEIWKKLVKTFTKAYKTIISMSKVSYLFVFKSFLF